MQLLLVCAVGFAFGFFGSMPLAGPISILVVSRAARQRFSEARQIGIGAAAAEAVYAGVAFWGFTSLVPRHPLVVPVSQAVTAVVLATLGLRFTLWPTGEAREPGEPRAGTWLVGFSLSAINPTLLLTWSTVAAFLYSKGLGVSSSFAAFPFSVSVGAGIGVWFTLLVAILRRLHGKLPRRALTWTIRALGLALLGLGAWSGLQLARWIARTPERSEGSGMDEIQRPPAPAAASLCFAGCRARRSTLTSPSRRPSTSCSGTASPAPRGGCWRTCSM
jgi:threonine/homoserine/homoserine lactone efflux protein